MRFAIGLFVLCGGSIMVTASPVQRSVIDAACQTLGINDARTLRITASGATFTVGQNFTPNVGIICARAGELSPVGVCWTSGRYRHGVRDRGVLRGSQGVDRRIGHSVGTDETPPSSRRRRCR
jgi:hypothetical protein